MDPGALALIVILGVEVVAIGGLVTYLLFRPRDKKKGEKLKPEEKVATAYGEPHEENGQVLLDNKEGVTHETTSLSSTSSDFKKKPVDEDSISITIENAPLYHEPPTVIQMDKEPEPDGRSDASDKVIEEDKSSSSSSSSSSEDERKKTPEEKRSSSSSSSQSEIDEPAVVPVARERRKSSDDDKVILEPHPVPVERSFLTKEPPRETTSSNSSSSEDDEKDVAALKKTSSSSSSSSSEDDGKTKFVKVKKKKEVVEVSASSSSSGDQIINRKKKTHRKKYIHNIEEVEIIEEHTINRTHKKIYKKAGGDKSSSSSSSETEEEEAPKKTKKKKVKRKKKKKEVSSSTSSSSSSSDEDVTSPTYSTEYHYDVTRDDDDKHITRTVIEKSSTPTSHVTKHRVYKETIREDKHKEFEMKMDESSSSSSESDSEKRMRSEKEISISSPPPPVFEPFTQTVVIEEEKHLEMKESSSSSSSESEDERRMRSETSIKLRSSPTHETITKTVVMDDESKPEVKESSSSSSSSSESDEEVRIKTQKNIMLKSPRRKQEPVTVTVVTKEEPPSSSTSSSSVENEAVLENDHVPEMQQAKVSEIVKDFDKKVELEENKVSQTTITTEEIVVTTTERIKKSRKDFHFTSGWKRRVTLEDLFNAGVVSQSTIEDLETGKIEQADVEKSLRLYLVGDEPIAGLIMSDTGEKVSIYDAWKKGLIRRGTSISLLEAQAATGRIIDPKSADKMSVNEATEKKLIDTQFEAVLTRAERAVYGYKTKLSKETLSLFEAMTRGLVVENHGIRLLEAQIATGGIVDPNANHRLPVEVAFERGLFDKRINDILEDPSDDTRGFFDPNTEENLTYLELMERCVIDQDTGLRLLPFRSQRKKPAAKISKVVFESATKRQVLLQDILDAELVDRKTAQKYDEGQMTSEEVKAMVAQLKVYVDGTLPIAGIINSQTGEKMSILEACRSNLIRRGTAFELLEAQAACGKIIDVQSCKPVSIETAVRTGVIDSEFEDVVSRANRAVTGYREPFKREVLSLCEAMARHLVVQRHAIRLLEAQIATGGIVDMRSPVRISVQVALKRGLIDSSLAKKLEKRETSSYFDPVTGENLNYSELMGRCVLDKDSNLLFLMIEGGTVTQNVRPFEPEPESMKIREKSPAKITTQVVQSKPKRRSSSKRSERPASPPPSAVPSSPPAILSRRVVIVDPNSGNELTVQEALQYNLIDEDTANQLIAQEGDFEEEEDL